MKKINNNNYQCLNAPNETYTKKEQSPKGRGISAISLPLGHEEEGVDKQIWVVHYKNNKKAWFRKSGMPLVSHEEPLLIDDNSNGSNGNSNGSNGNSSGSNGNQVKINEEEQIEPKEEPENSSGDKNEQKEKKMTDYNYFYKYYSNKLKTENSNKNKEERKSNKDIQTEIFEEWNRLKKNKNELEELLKIIKK